jgi:hypothetical protein
MSYDHNVSIYIICGGLSVNDVIRSVNNNMLKDQKTNKKSFFNIFSSKKNNKEENNKSELEKIVFKPIEEEKYSKLIELGIKEVSLCKSNGKISNIINNPNNQIFTSLDYNCIETASLLFYDNTGMNIINAVSYLSNTNKIKDKIELVEFIKEFGNYNKNKFRVNQNNYWNKTKIKNIPILNSTDLKGVINWNMIYEKSIKKYNVYNFRKFEKLLKEIFEFELSSHGFINQNIIVSNAIFISDILKEMPKKYSKDLHFIEYSSVWEIKIKLKISTVTNKIINMVYNDFEKEYPTKNNYKPLDIDTRYQNYKYTYKFKDFKYNLFNTFENIPMEYIKNMYLDRYTNNTKKLIKKYINKNGNSKVKSNNIKSLNNI